MRTIALVESQSRQVALDAAEASQLHRLGRALASDLTWWGDSDEDGDRHDRTVIRCREVRAGTYEVRVSDAIGAIGLGDLQLIVGPKIPLPHLLFLLERAETLPRLAGARTALDTGGSFFELIAHWFVTAAETLLRHELARDYTPTTSDLAAARGRVAAAPTAVAILRGRPQLRCTFDDYSFDTPLNRTISAAARALESATTLDRQLRRRCRRIRVRIAPVGAFRPGDLRAVPDRRTAHYRDAHTLAKAVLGGHGTASRSGTAASWTFLFRTPEPVEEGIRNVLAAGLERLVRVHKTGRLLAGTKRRTINPDLVFGDTTAVGDVKYSLAGSDIARRHLEQLTTFATGYGCDNGILVGFADPPRTALALVGPVTIRTADWNLAEEDPARAAADLVERTMRLLATLLPE